MKQVWQNLKKSLRPNIKYAQSLVKGYPFRYANSQTPDGAELYMHKWIEFSTPIPDRGTTEIRANRIWNLQLAAKRINFLNLAPQQIFSFSDRIGNPTKSNGFREAPTFVRGQIKNDIGGGLCLLATNVFNTFLYGGCQILERHSHSIDAYGESRFYKLGQDAAVAYGYKDLIIRNHSQIPLQLRLTVLEQENRVESSLWGSAPKPWQVKVESHVIEKISPPDPQHLSGWVVETSRYIHEIEIAHSPSWQRNYETISFYSPCIKS
ncbi:MAG: hypothetical protein DCF19_00605 [Pseudanabaena frigida]|uniref:Vancomycin resistance protein n=1 Tax=Pseudanabaena frigida TaxID=945775 RepID=A0A2W4WT54_9CYAN|nr:MAG: hypothetical protein DCF19_00605 [Pseudanabaena frigida]